MLIAIPTDGKHVAGHFGRCEKYTLFTYENNNISNIKDIENPGHEPGFLPKYLSEKGVNCIIASGMGQKAQALFNQYNIEMIMGCQGEIKNVIEMYKNNKLVSGKSTCNHDEHEDHCH
jgi:predicted Fe-Mo cluster-binding NifX family protein